MTWTRVPFVVRLCCLLLGAGAFAVAWRLTSLGATGAEDIPPPFTLAAGLVGLVLAVVGLGGRYPKLPSH